MCVSTCCNTLCVCASVCVAECPLVILLYQQNCVSCFQHDTLIEIQRQIISVWKKKGNLTLVLLKWFNWSLTQFISEGCQFQRFLLLLFQSFLLLPSREKKTELKAKLDRIVCVCVRKVCLFAACTCTHTHYYITSCGIYSGSTCDLSWLHLWL